MGVHLEYKVKPIEKAGHLILLEILSLLLNFSNTRRQLKRENIKQTY
jgi:hypothetical protein